MKRRSISSQFPVPPLLVSQHWANNGISQRDKDDLTNERRSKSSLDIRSVDESPRISRRKKIWNSFKRFRSRSRDKSRKQKDDNRDSDIVESEVDLSLGSNDQVNSKGLSSGIDTESLFDDRDREGSIVGSSDRSDLNGNIKSKKTSSRRSSKASLKRNSSLLEKSKDSEHDSGVIEQCSESAAYQRHAALREHPFFQLEIHLKEGKDLVAMDSCGTSDPYVKFKIGNKLMYKSRTIYKTLNPEWNERCCLPIDDPDKVIRVMTYDYDRGVSDDPMGVAEIDLKSLDLNVPTDLRLNLLPEKGKSKKRELGYLLLECTLVPKTQEDKEQYFKRSMKDPQKKLKTQVWSSVVTIVLVEGHDLLPMDDNGLSDPYVKFKLGTEKYKSKYKPKTLNPTWLEQFDLHMFDEQTSHLEISVWDHDTGGKDDIMGRASIDLSELEMETTHTLDKTLEDGAGYIRLLLTISGTVGTETVSDLANYTPNPKQREDLCRRYNMFNTPKSIKDVGWLQVKAIKAENVAAADIGGKSDPFCVLELVNSRLQTHTEYKTLCPEWGKIFTFSVKDIHSNLEVTVFDEDRDKKVEFLGKIAIPLLRIKPGERKWYTLKDKKLLKRSKGAILLELDLLFNDVRAAIRTINPAETKYMKPDPKFKISVMKRNIDRVSKLAEAGVESGKFLKSCFNWESKVRSITAFAVYLILVWNFELYMLPLSLLIVFLKNLLVVQIVGHLMKDKDEDEYVDDDDDEEEDDKDKEEKKSFKEKLQAIQEVCLQVQEGMDMAASMGERVKNTFNWTVPWLSWLAVIALTVGTVVLYFVPLRILLILWGINKFTKRLRKGPDYIDNNELLDFLSRIPSDKEQIMYRELRPDPGIGTTKKKRS